MAKFTKIFLLSCFILGNFGVNIHAQFLVKSGGLNQDEILDVTTDAAGNTYATGYFGSTLNFAGGVSVSSSGLSDIFLLKSDNTGQVLWAVKAGGTADERGNAVSVDNAGNVYITGYFQGTATFGATSLTSAGLQDVFTAKYNNAGNLQWVRRAGGTGADISSGLSVDNVGNVVITGEFKNTADFGALNVTAQAADAFICKYDAAGTALWVKKGSGVDNSRGLDIAFDAAGNVYGLGQFSNDISFDVLQSNNILNAVYLVKFNAAGAEQWFRKIGGAASNIGYSLDIDATSNVYLTGDFTGNLVFFPNTGSPLSSTYTNRIFLAKYNDAGTFQWAKAAGSESELSSRKVCIGPAGQVYIGGWYKCTFDEYSAVYGEGTFNSVGFKDGFVARYDQSGTRIWARNFGGVKDDYVTSLAPAPNDMPIVSAVFIDDIKIPYNPALNYSFDNPPIVDTTIDGASTYCADNNYNKFLYAATSGGTDLIFGNLIDPLKSPYDYYLRLTAGCNLDQIDVCITNLYPTCPDSIHLCGPDDVFAQSNTTWAGPDFTYQWSNGGTNPTTTITTSGTYTVTQTSADGCYVTTDNIYVEVNPLPPIPLISDDAGVNNQAAFPQVVKVCDPEDVVLTGNNMGMPTFQWQAGNPQSTTITLDSVGNYYMVYTIENQYGCIRENSVQVQILPGLPPIDPSIYFFADFDHNDTISYCGPGSLQLGFMDSTNTIINCDLYTLSGDVTINQQPFGNYTFCNNVGLALYSYVVDTSGWYHIQVSMKQYNLCDTIFFNLSDSIYVEMFDLPQGNLDLIGSTYLCSNDTVFLTAVADVPFTWSGGYAYLVDSVTAAVTQPGVVQITSLLTDTVTGCQTTILDTASVSYVLPPIIESNPSTSIICPNDSLLLSVTNPQYYTTFQWIGPQGQIGGNSSSIYVYDAGIYYCIATTASGCSQQSNTIELSQYGTPYLVAFPNTRLCPGLDSVFVSVIAPPNSIIQWDAPLSGGDTTQIITQPGTYTVQVNSCGTTTVTDIVITQSDLSASIIPQDVLLFCEGDSVVLETVSTGAISYTWSPVADTTSNITAFQSGSYTVTVEDTAGCTFQSQPIVVSVTPDNIPAPEIADTAFCPPDQVLLTASGIGMIYWFNNTSAPAIDSGATYQTPQLSSPTTYYLQQYFGGCYSPIVPVELTEASCTEVTTPNVFTPNGDGINDYISFNIDGATCFYAEIRNRWGVKVFETHVASTPWYGTVMNGNTPVVDGTYFYIIEYCPHTGGNKTAKGFITVAGH